MTTQEIATYCRLCDATCGLVATVSDGRIAKLTNDPDHVGSRGHFCVKGPAMVNVVYDPDRVRTPMRRTGAPGEFEPCEWDEALDDIARRLLLTRNEHGPSAVATLVGNPSFYNVGTLTAMPIFQRGLGILNKYSINSEDGAARQAASALLYGTPHLMPKPDLWRSRLAIFIGSNPLVSKSSIFTEPQTREALDQIVANGGRVVIIDPRQTESAKRYEHISIWPGSDPWLLLGMARTILDEAREDRPFLDAHTVGIGEFADALRAFDIGLCAEQCHVPEDVIVALARDLAAAPSGLIIGRTGTCTQQFGTLANMLQDIVSILSGNFDREGGLLAGWGIFSGAGETAATPAPVGTRPSFGRYFSRVDQLPEVAGHFPSHALVNDILEPGDGQVRALVSVSSNAVLSSGASAGPRMQEALKALDLHVSLDLYINETNKFSDYILPSPTMYERDDFPLSTQAGMLRPALWATRAVVARIGDTREEWVVLADIAQRLGVGGGFMVGDVPFTPEAVIDKMLADSARADLTFDKLVEQYPHGISIRPDLPTLNFLGALKTKDRRIGLAHPEMLHELELLMEHSAPSDFPMRVIGMRELGSMNSWLHNAEALMPKRRRFAARINPDDAADANIADGEACDIVSVEGAIRAIAMLTSDVPRGVIAVPHGWGHEGGWRRANAAGGSNSNLLASYRRADIERLAGMSVLNGIPVHLARAASSGGDGGKDVEAD